MSMLATGSRTEWHDKVRRAEDLGYDVLLMPDHFGMPAPLPALLSAAHVTSMRICPLVLNAGIYRSAVLARDVAEVQSLTDGRLEIGIGTGYIPREFELAGVEFQRPGKRIEHLDRTVREVRAHVADAAGPQAVPPFLLAGRGDRMLSLAAREADIVQLFTIGSGGSEADRHAVLGERVDFVRGQAGDRFAGLELSLFVFTVVVTRGGAPDLSLARMVMGSGPSAEQLLAMPGVLTGSVDEIADTVTRYAQEHGVTYMTVPDPHMEDFGRVIRKLR